MADDITRTLHQMLADKAGEGEYALHLAKKYGVQALSGIKGLSVLPQGMDAAADAVREYQKKYGPSMDLSPNGAGFIRYEVAPVYRSIKNSPVGAANSAISNSYDEGSQELSDLAGKYLGPTAAGVVGAAADVAPYMAVTEDGLLGAPKSAMPAAELSDFVAKYAPERAYDNSTMHTLANEQWAAQNAKPAYTKATIPTSQLDPSLHPANFTPPDNAQSVVAMDPVTGKQVAHVTYVKRGDGVQSLRMDTDPLWRGNGIAPDLLKDAVSNAHDMGLPYRSDTQVSVPAAKTYEKLPGAVRNEDVTHTRDDTDGDVGVSNNGRPVYEIPRMPDADDATPDELPQFDPNSWIRSQAYAEGGEVAPLLEDLAAMVAKYADAPPLKGIPAGAPNPEIRKVAAQYMHENGITPKPPGEFVKADPDRAARIAQAYDAMQHAPNDPKVKASYDALIKETKDQYQHIKATGFTPEFIPQGAPDPYAASPRMAIDDINQNNHMWVFPTSAGFGSDAAMLDHPLLSDSGEAISGIPATNNDIFRVVHDYFGHAKEGNGFRANGEENAWLQHANMYSPEARPAMTAETRGQNSWVNFGPHAAHNATASGADTIYAPQKAGLLPDEFNQPMMDFAHYSNLDTPKALLDPAYYGTGIKGAEAARGGTKTISLYPNDIAQPEPGLEHKTKYRVSVPADQMYDMSSDPLGLRANAPSYSDAEDAVREAGFLGYHVPEGQGIFRGQARMFGPTPAVRISAGEAPGAAISAEPVRGSVATKKTPPSANDSGIYDDTADTGDFADGGPVKMAEGGELAPVLEDIGAMVAKYAEGAPNDHAAQLADAVKTDGGVTYNPTTGDVHTSGYAVPSEPSRSVALDSAPSASDIHDFMLQNQDAFDNPKAALHIESDGRNHFMHVAHIEPDFEGAMAAAHANDSHGIRELHTGVNFPTKNGDAAAIGESSDPDVEDYLGFSKIPAANLPAELDADRNARQTVKWTPGKPTVAKPQRVAFPGIYNDPRQVISDSNAMVGPEDPLLHRLFGVNRQDLSDIALSRQGNELGILPGAKQNPTGAASALGVMTPQNEQRLIDVLSAARGTPLYTGMTGWYTMDPLYQRFVEIFGEDEAPAKYAQFNTLSGMASPGSDVGTEIARGTSANWLQNQGRFGDFAKYAGVADDRRASTPGFPQDMMGVPGHAYHPTAQAGPMARYLSSGEVQMNSPKVPPYIQSSSVPDVGFQTDLPVGDAHWARGVGLADTRNPRTRRGEEIVPGASVSTPEMQVLAPWWRDRVAAQAGYQSVPAQATAWGAFAPYTGVESAIGAPKLEILSTQIGKLANRLGISPETARDMVISGQAGAY